MSKKTEQQVMEVLRNFYRKYEGVELKSRTEINRALENKYPNWQRNPDEAAFIREQTLKHLPIDDFYEEKEATFNNVFNGWTIREISEFAKKYDNVLNEFTRMKEDINQRNPVGVYVHHKKEQKMREADAKLKAKLGDSLDFRGYDKTVNVHGNKIKSYTDLQMQWIKEQEMFDKK